MPNDSGPKFKPGPAGWSAVAVWVTFDDSEPVPTVVNEVDGVLSRQSWTRHDLHNKSDLDIPAWTKDIGKGRLAIATLEIVATSHNYGLDAEWRPPGNSEVACLVG
jgi:hypothetical protein